MENRIARVEREVETMLGIQAGMSALLTAVVMTHPRHEDFQLAATMCLEKTLADNRAPLSDRQRETARSFAEALLQIGPLNPGTQQAWIAAQLRGASRR